MNKALLLLSAGLLLTWHCSGQAEPAKPQAPGRPSANAALQRILDAQHARRSNAKSTAQMPRVIGLSAYHNGVLTDTLRYFYSNGRGCLPIVNLNPLQYDATYLIFPNNDGHVGLYAYPRASCDSLYQFESSAGGPLIPYGRTVVNYTANNKVAGDTQASYSSTGLSVSIFEYTYNAAGYISRQRAYDSLQAGPNPYKPHFDEYFTYDAGNNVILDSSVNVATGQPTIKYIRTHNAAGYQTLERGYSYNAGTWVLGDSTVYTYDAYNRILGFVIYSFSGIIPYIQQTDSLAYTGTSPFQVYSRTRFYNFSPNTVSNGYYFYGHINAAGDNYDTTTGYSFYGSGTPTPSDREVSFFNGDGTLAEVDTYEGTSTGFPTVSYKNFVYYEQYDPTGIMPVAGAPNTLLIFPNPADAGLTIKMRQTPFTKGSVLVVTDAACRTLLRQATNNEPELHLNIAAWPKGWYCLSLTGSDGLVLGRTTFLH